MSRFLHAPLFLLLALTLWSGAAPADRTYKWVDEDGVTHYSQYPPPDREAEIIEPDIGLPSGTGGSDAATETAGAGEGSDADDDGPATMEAYCNQLSEQEQMLASDREVRVRRDDGSLEPLEGDARAAKRAEVQHQLDRHCG